MLADINNTKEAPEKIDFPMFRKFLDLNPALREIVKEAMKPDLWTFGKGVLKGDSNHSSGGNRGGFGCFAPTNKNNKGNYNEIQKSPERKQAYVKNAGAVRMEGELLKVGKKTERFVERHYVL